jgi:exodeoxyribonuclease VII small subunit
MAGALPCQVPAPKVPAHRRSSQTPMTESADIAELTFEQALAELERIVADLESGQAPLEHSIEMYARGAQLKAHCETRLNAARLRVEKIVMGPQGAPERTEPAEFT